MAISTAAELKTALANWLKRDDLTDRLDEFIVLAEAGFNRVLRVRAMEAAMTSTALTDGAASLPTAFRAFKEVRHGGSTNYTLTPKSLEWVRSQAASTSDARHFAVSGTQVVCWPTTGPILGTYYRSIPSLVGNSDNWLLLAHPDLYLFACLTEAAIYSFDEEHANFWRQRASALLNEIQESDERDEFDGGIISIRAR